MKNRNHTIIAMLLALGFLGLSQRAQALIPPPDGGYPGGNTAEGQNALGSHSISGYNTALGWFALASTTDGGFNTGVGAATLVRSIGAENTATGVGALLSNTTGSGNTANGTLALSNNTTGSDNIALGRNAGSGVITTSNVIVIGTEGNDVDNSCYIGNIFGATSSNGVGVFVNSNGRLGTVTSSRRFKERIKPMGDASETLFSLEPVSFRYKKGVDPESPEGRSQFGLVAEDVEKVNPDLVVRDKEGKPYSVRYDQVNAMLLNEFLKEHKKVQDLETTVARQQKGMEILTALLKEQAAQIQKVSAQLEVNKPTPRVVKNKP